MCWRRGEEEGDQVHANRSDAWFACINHSTNAIRHSPLTLHLYHL